MDTTVGVRQWHCIHRTCQYVDRWTLNLPTVSVFRLLKHRNAVVITDPQIIGEVTLFTCLAATCVDALHGRDVEGVSLLAQFRMTGSIDPGAIMRC